MAKTKNAVSDTNKSPVADTNAPTMGPRPKGKPAVPPKTETAYLFMYNFASSIAWATVLVRALTYAARVGPEGVYPGVGDFTRKTQTWACLEILHSLTGRVIPSPSTPPLLSMMQSVFLPLYTICAREMGSKSWKGGEGTEEGN